MASGRSTGLLLVVRHLSGVQEQFFFVSGSASDRSLMFGRLDPNQSTGSESFVGRTTSDRSPRVGRSAPDWSTESSSSALLPTHQLTSNSQQNAETQTRPTVIISFNFCRVSDYSIVNLKTNSPCIYNIDRWIIQIFSTKICFQLLLMQVGFQATVSHINFIWNHKLVLMRLNLDGLHAASFFYVSVMTE